MKNGLAAPLAGMGIAFSSSLFGLAGSLVLGFLDLQAGQAQSRFYTELEDWLADVDRDTPADWAARAAIATTSRSALIERSPQLVEDGAGGRASTRRWPTSPKASGHRAAHARGAADGARLGRGAGRPASRN